MTERDADIEAEKEWCRQRGWDAGTKLANLAKKARDERDRAQAQLREAFEDGIKEGGLSAQADMIQLWAKASAVEERQRKLEEEIMATRDGFRARAEGFREIARYHSDHREAAEARADAAEAALAELRAQIPFLLSVIACGESLSADEIQHLRALAASPQPTEAE